MLIEVPDATWQLHRVACSTDVSAMQLHATLTSVGSVQLIVLWRSGHRPAQLLAARLQGTERCCVKEARDHDVLLMTNSLLRMAGHK